MVAYGSGCDTFAYDAYGNRVDPLKDSVNDGLFYTGEMHDPETNQYYLRARYYNPMNGLFNRMDPFAGNTQDPQSLHKYLYCHNNPVNCIDPSGMLNLTELSQVMMITGLIVDIVGLGMIICGDITNNDLLTSIGGEVLIIGLAMMSSGAGLAFKILSATEAVMLQIIISAFVIGYSFSGGVMSTFIKSSFSIPNIITNLQKSNIQIPTHGILIFENGGNNIDLVDYINKGNFEWLKPPVKYRKGDRVLEYWIDSNVGSKFSVEVKDVVGIREDNQPIFEIVSDKQDFDIETSKMYYNGFNWGVIPKKRE